MGSLDPHVSVLIDYANEAVQFLAVLWRVNLEDGLNLFQVKASSLHE